MTSLPTWNSYQCPFRASYTSSVHCVWLGVPVESMREATFTVLPQMSYFSNLNIASIFQGKTTFLWESNTCGFLAPMTPATTGPTFRPTRRVKLL